MGTTKEWLDENLKDWKKPVSTSSMTDGLGCARKFLYRSKWRLKPRISPFTPNASVGKYLHRLQELGPDGVDTLREEVIKTHEKLLKEINQGGDLTGELSAKAHQIGETLDKAIAIARIYWEVVKPAEYIEILAREQTVESKVLTVRGELPVLNRIDRIDRDSRNGSVWVRDTKCTGQGFDSVLTGYTWCVQCRMYRVATRSWLTISGRSDKLVGFILDMITIPGIKYCPTTKDKPEDGGFNHYIQRVKEWYKEHEEKGEEMMTSMAIQYTEPLFHPEFVSKLDLIHTLWAMDPDPVQFERDQTKTHCFAYRRKCPYFDLCNSDVSAWPSTIEQRYELRPGTKEGDVMDKEDEVGSGGDD